MPPPNGFGSKSTAQYGKDQSNDGSDPITYGNTSSSDEEYSLHDASGSVADGSPLSPMSREILGKLAKPPRKKPNANKKRPAPVVDEAYR
jgi:hypothetical protein